MANGISGPESCTVNERIIELANQGLTTQQIADEIGMKRGAVGGRMSRLMARGGLERQLVRSGNIKTAKGRYWVMRERHKKNLGNMGQILVGLTFDEVDWIFSNTPEEMTAAEWCAALLKDVIAEENDND
jgi:DNA-binding CsgD family transcriptional regulator